MDKIVGIVSQATQARAKNDDDFADRLSSRYTVVLLAVFALLVGFTQVSDSNGGITTTIKLAIKLTMKLKT